MSVHNSLTEGIHINAGLGRARRRLMVDCIYLCHEFQRENLPRVQEFHRFMSNGKIECRGYGKKE